MTQTSLPRLALPVLAALLAATLARAADTKVAPEPLAPVVTTVLAKRAELVDAVQVTGTLVAREEVLVGPEIEGLRIVQLLVEEGDTIAKGQVLARLSRDQLDALLAQSTASLRRADAAIAQARSQIAQFEATAALKASTLARTQTLRTQGISTDASFDLAQADAIASKAQLAAARDGLNLAEADKANIAAQREELQVRIGRTEVRAPLGGIVSRRSARLGAVATAIGDPMFRVIAEGALELEAEVPELRIAKMRAGMEASVSLGDVATVPGRLRLVSPEVDKSSRLGKVRVALEKNDALRLGAFARGTIIVERKQALALPLSSVLYDAKGPFVQGVRDGAVYSAPVTLGLAAGGQVEIVEGVAEGASIIARAGSFLRAGDKVRVAPPAGAAQSVAPANTTAEAK